LSDWSLLTNHARLLLLIDHERGLRVRDMAEWLHLSERGTALILRDLREAGYVTSRREGRRVFYSVVPSKPLRSDLLKHQTVGQLLELITETAILDRTEREGTSASRRSA
jgi:MarR-like DNA-binding transcriptional regulator SgrR of sgrS sRNA